MEDALILETTFLIDLERETARDAKGPARSVLETYALHRLFVTPTIAGELAAGASMKDRERWEGFLRLFQILPLSVDVSWEYGNTSDTSSPTAS